MQITNNRYTSDHKGRFKCPTCSTLYTFGDLRSDIDVKEAGISGMCQQCQDYVFLPDTLE